MRLKLLDFYKDVPEKNRREDHYIQGLNNIEHGGGCCGIMHLNTFPISDEIEAEPLETKVSWLRQAITDIVMDYDPRDPEGGCDCGDSDCTFKSDRDSTEDWSCAIEVTLNQTQTPVWREALESVGFKEVLKFYNSNSGNEVYVFYMVTKGLP